MFNLVNDLCSRSITFVFQTPLLRAVAHLTRWRNVIHAKGSTGMLEQAHATVRQTASAL